MKVEVDVNHSTADNYIDSSRIAFLGYRCVSGICVSYPLNFGFLKVPIYHSMTFVFDV